MILAALTAAAVTLPITLTHSMFELIDRATLRRLDTTAARHGARSATTRRAARGW